MTAQRILKETRPLFWPWCAVALAGALPLVYPLDWTALIYLIGFFDVPVMATLAVGEEFQQSTLSLLLSQPVGRMEIWREKLSITVVAVLSAVLLFSLALRATAFHPDRQQLAFAGAWIVVITASATFWTLFTRSVVGGVALNIAVQSFLIFIVPWASMADGLRARGYLAPENAIVPLTVALVVLGYAGAMVWLGGRMLARFQVTGGMAGDDLLMAGPSLMPGALAGWWRCHPRGAIFNLIRKELRLLRPVWLISLLAGVEWACLALFGVFRERGFSKDFETAVLIVSVLDTLMIAILAGSLSLGEERTSGRHAWHLTLPASAFRQWLSKLFMALLAGCVGAWLLPWMVTGGLLGFSRTFVDVHLGIGFWLLIVLLLTFASFWCACAANGTVGAVLWVCPAVIAIGLACLFGERAGRELVHVLVARFGLFASFRSAVAISHLGPKLTVGLVSTAWNNMTDSLLAAVRLRILLLVPTLLFAIVQSYRLFRSQLQDRSWSVARSLQPLTMTAFVCSFSLLAYHTLVDNAMGQSATLLFTPYSAIEEILRGRALAKTVPGAANPDGTEELQLTSEDLVKALNPRFPLLENENARHWLRNARITVTPDKAHPQGFFCAETPWKWTSCYFSATIRLADGTDLTESYEPSANQHPPFGRFSAYVHWPGAQGQELLWGR